VLAQGFLQIKYVKCTFARRSIWLVLSRKHRVIYKSVSEYNIFIGFRCHICLAPNGQKALAEKLGHNFQVKTVGGSLDEDLEETVQCSLEQLQCLVPGFKGLSHAKTLARQLLRAAAVWLSRCVAVTRRLRVCRKGEIETIPDRIIIGNDGNYSSSHTADVSV